MELLEINFLDRLRRQCQDFDAVCHGAWQLGPGMFMAHLSDKDGSNRLFGFYFDNSQTALRNSRLMDRTLQLLMFDVNIGSLSKDPEDHLRILHFGDDPVGNPDNGINYATQLFTSIEGKEIDWLDNPRSLDLIPV